MKKRVREIVTILILIDGFLQCTLKDIHCSYKESQSLF